MESVKVCRHFLPQTNKHTLIIHINYTLYKTSTCTISPTIYIACPVNVHRQIKTVGKNPNMYIRMYVQTVCQTWVRKLSSSEHLSDVSGGEIQRESTDMNTITSWLFCSKLQHKSMQTLQKCLLMNRQFTGIGYCVQKTLRGPPSGCFHRKSFMYLLETLGGKRRGKQCFRQTFEIVGCRGVESKHQS